MEFHRQAGFPVVVLRHAWVYGPGCPRTRKLYRALKKGRFVMIGSGKNLRHPVYIGDFIAACEQTLDSPGAVGQTFIIAGERPLTSRELVGAFCRTLELPHPRLRIPFPVGTLLAMTVEATFRLAGKTPPLSRRSLEFFETDNAFDIGKARGVLGFKPAYDLQQGLALAKPWLRDCESN